MPRARKLRIISSDEDEGDESKTIITTEVESTSNTLGSRTRATRATRSTSTSTSRTAASTLNGSSSQTSALAAGTATKSSKSSRTKASSSSITSPRKSSISKASSSKAAKQSQPISSFFTPASQPAKRQKKGTITQLSEEINEHEDIDGIEFSSDEENDRKNRRRQVIPIISSEPDELPRKLPPPAKSKPSEKISAAATVNDIIETQTWADKYAPKSTVDLAVHKRKIDDVRSWLNDVFTGVSAKRLLVLSGPSGTGKTATVTALGGELDFDILKWENPSQHDIGGDYLFESLNSKFEEFMGRGTGYGALPLVVHSRSHQDGAPVKKVEEPKDPNRRQVILLEDLPNIFSSSTSVSSAMMSFRSALHTFLATPQDSMPSPCILIISENLTTQSNSTSITPHRLLGPQLLNHRKTTSITFNKIAAGIMQKALDKVVDMELRSKAIKEAPSAGLLAGIGACGDIRSAINTLEFMMVAGRGKVAYPKKVPITKGKKKGRSISDWGQPSDSEKLTLELITQRESSLGIFHAVGKIVWNKRFDASEPQVLPPETLPDPIPSLSSYSRPPSLVDVKSLIDTAGVDLDTFVSGIHENYLQSCGGSSFPEHFEACIEHLSDSDILSYNVSPGGRNQVEDNFRQDELAFQVAVRGTLMGLPVKVKRATGKTSMYYPMSQRLWRDREVVEGLVSMFIANGLSDFGNSKIAGGMADMEALLEYFPYTHRIAKAKMRSKGGLRTPAMKNLEKVVLFRGVGDQSEAIPDGPDEEEEVENGEEDEMGNVKVKRKVRRQKEDSGQYGGRFKKRKDGGVGVSGIGEGEKDDGDVEESLEALVLVEDDIEDDDNW
ncbi:hypothetical protein H072_9083 [Dactylellina haptotyla CBS 200.50]|uniref:Checkpoint protein RAD24-like helical bundle domain-containing protein n=1 Tax=Dactylellina haptotyla (strain CBS 200.50) TaxID=1284197 RepID=S8A860_DACHA|nr:hypothetical protein H072_9083 [Dactylellina haptotyla CBS 200.50]